MKESTIFALDIGTRSVVGVVMEESSEGLEIIASECTEHKHQAMIDGQIHDIAQAAVAVKEIKENLEAKLGYELEQVAVAAAGRALKTVRTKVNIKFEDLHEIKYDDVLRLELEGVQKAQKELPQVDKEKDKNNVIYNCVGYSVVYYQLDGDKIKNLVGQKGMQIAVDIIATFLPRVVVDSLFAVLQRAGLEMMSLTLEPIAASTVVVPESMRQLSIALVDVGAGTSDIALTSDGAIIGYEMVPMAGDEITEKISQEYLVDFYQAEKMKRQLMEVDELEFQDILGNSQKVTSEEVMDAIEETVNNLAQQICEKILYINQRQPQAVICIGGGSLTPLLKEKIADNLELTQQRVAIRGREAILDVIGAQNLAGPDAVTPIGIAVTAYQNKGLGFAKVTINGKQIRLFEVNKATVGDSLLAAGIDMKKLIPRLGMALTVTVNGKLEIIRGSRGTPAVILLNGKEVSIDAPIRHNDIIEFTPAQNGQDATGTVGDIISQFRNFKIGLNNEVFEVKPIITMNDESAYFETELIDNAKIMYHLPQTVGEILEQAGYSGDISEYDIFVNSQKVELMFELKEGDNVSVIKNNLTDVEEPTEALGSTEVEQLVAATGTLNLFSEQEVNEQGSINLADHLVDIANEEISQIESSGLSTLVYVNDQKLVIPRENIILTDIFDKVDFPLVPPEPGSRLIMKVNGGLAEFTTPLNIGDQIELKWVNYNK